LLNELRSLGVQQCKEQRGPGDRYRAKRGKPDLVFFKRPASQWWTVAWLAVHGSDPVAAVVSVRFFNCKLVQSDRENAELVCVSEKPASLRDFCARDGFRELAGPRSGEQQVADLERVGLAFSAGKVADVHSVTPNVRVKRATAAGRQARAGENVPRTACPGLVACRWRSA